jgi:hypothetical protein
LDRRRNFVISAINTVAIDWPSNIEDIPMGKIVAKPTKIATAKANHVRMPERSDSVSGDEATGLTPISAARKVDVTAPQSVAKAKPAPAPLPGEKVAPAARRFR